VIAPVEKIWGIKDAVAGTMESVFQCPSTAVQPHIEKSIKVDAVTAQFRSSLARLSSFVFWTRVIVFLRVWTTARRTGEQGDVNMSRVQYCRLTKWVPMPGKMTRQVVEENINKSRRRMDVPALDMLQFHWSARTSF
jgi:hypothetical protein